MNRNACNKIKTCIFTFEREMSTNPPEEDVVSLVVEGCNSLPSKLRIIVEQGGEHSKNKEFNGFLEIQKSMKNFGNKSLNY